MPHKVLAVDIGKKGAWGIASYASEKTFIAQVDPTTEYQGLLHFYKFFKEKILIYQKIGCPIQAIITGKPNRFHKLIIKHYEYIAMLDLLGEEFDLPVFVVNDSSMRLSVLGKGFGNKKAAVHTRYKGKTPDCSDACLFLEYLLLLLAKTENED